MSMAANIVFRTPFFEIEEIRAAGVPNDLPYYRLNAPDSVICCLLSQVGEFLMVRQYRPNLGTHTLEFPAGEIDRGETPETAARREIREEVGVNAQLIPLGHYLLMMNRTNAKNHLFLCLESSDQIAADTEDGIECLKVSRTSFKKMVADGQYYQLAGLGILELASIHLNIDLLGAPIETIKSLFDRLAVPV